MIHKYEKLFEACMKKMFAVVGEKYPNWELTDQDSWFTKRTWTPEQEDKFKKWMAEYLKKKTRWRKDVIRAEVAWFLLMYGWKCSPPRFML